jgi:carbon monoxide dehydrogenase subunit G
LAIEGEYRIAAAREVVWQALNDPQVLQACIPGCEQLSRRSDTEIDGRINAQIGPVRSVFATHIVLSELNPPSGYTLTGEGKSSVGFGKGSARVELSEDSGVTVLRYSADMRLGGKLAQIGSRLVEGATRQLADQFFDAFAQRLDAAAVRAQPEAPPGAARGWPWRWIVVALLLVAALVWWLAR